MRRDDSLIGSLAGDLGSFSESGESSGSDMARHALDRIVGDAEWVAAADHYVSCRRGGQLARSVMWLVNPWAAMLRCNEIVQTSDAPERRRRAGVGDKS